MRCSKLLSPPNRKSTLSVAHIKALSLEVLVLEYRKAAQ